MKERSGLVSNSSSSSFCIYGWGGSISQARKLLSATLEGQALLGRIGESNDPSDWSEEDPRLRGDGSDDGYYIYYGEEWCRIRDTETGAEFKERIREATSHLLGPAAAEGCGTIKKAWYNG